MKRVQITFLLIVAVLMVGQASLAKSAGSKKGSLYERIGGSEAIGKIFDEVGGRMAADPLLARFFEGQSNEALMAQRQKAIEFLCHQTGGPCAYTGRPLKTAHGSLGITESQWNAFMKHLETTLDNQKIGAREKREFLALVKGFKSDVVEKK